MCNGFVGQHQCLSALRRMHQTVTPAGRQKRSRSSQGRGCPPPSAARLGLPTACIASARQVLVDVNWRPVFFDDEEAAKKVILPYVLEADLLKVGTSLSVLMLQSLVLHGAGIGQRRAHAAQGRSAGGLAMQHAVWPQARRAAGLVCCSCHNTEDGPVVVLHWAGSCRCIALGRKRTPFR